MTHHRQLQSEDGFVMVPVIILLVVAIAVSLALLAIVDTQTGESREQRSADSAQTLAEGVVNATGNVLAANPSLWPTTGACVPVTGDLMAPAPAGTTLAAKVAAEVKARFKPADSSADLATTASHATTWTVDVCPVDASDGSRWEETMLQRTSTVPVSAAQPASVWVRGHASVRSRVSAASAQNVRTVVSKVRQSPRDFLVPADFAVGTGAFSTDISTTLSTNVTSNSTLLGGLVKPLVAAQTSKIGIRCGVLDTIQNTHTTCLAGALAGVGGVTNATGLGKLNGVLGLRNEQLPTWTMAPKDAIESWRDEAKANGVWSAEIPGFGDVRTATKSVAGGDNLTRDCFPGDPTGKVVFIEKVGSNGEQYCNVPENSRARILIVERGGIRLKRGTFTGVVYALNKQECGSDGDCSADEREAAAPREVVRIDGNFGKVVGSVWADGAGGSVGIYPTLLPPSAISNSSLLNLGGVTNALCGIPALSATLTTLNTTLTSVGTLLGNTLALLGGVQEQVRYPNGVPSVTGCDLLATKLGTLTSSELLNLFAANTTQPVVVSEHRTRNCLVLCGAWSAWTTRDTSNLPVQSLLTGASPAVIAQVTGLLGGLLNNYTAITYNETVVRDAAAHINQGAAPLVGTYRNVGPST